MRLLTVPFGAARPLGGVVLAAVFALLGYVVRYQFIEPEILGAICDEAGAWWCPPRRALIIATEFNGFGWLSLLLVAVALALPRRSSWAAHATLIVGGAGLVLYNATVSAVAVVLAMLCLAFRTQPAGDAAKLRREA